MVFDYNSNLLSPNLLFWRFLTFRGWGSMKIPATVPHTQTDVKNEIKGRFGLLRKILPPFWPKVSLFL